MDLLTSVAALFAAPPGAAWPELPRTGFLSGRVASEADLKAGNAVFVQRAEATEALEILVPQYAIWKSDDGAEIPVVVVQAEGSEAGNIIGMRDVQGNECVATLEEITLLGLRVPRK